MGSDLSNSRKDLLNQVGNISFQSKPKNNRSRREATLFLLGGKPSEVAIGSRRVAQSTITNKSVKSVMLEVTLVPTHLLTGKPNDIKITCKSSIPTKTQHIGQFFPEKQESRWTKRKVKKCASFPMQGFIFSIFALQSRPYTTISSDAPRASTALRPTSRSLCFPTAPHCTHQPSSSLSLFMCENHVYIPPSLSRVSVIFLPNLQRFSYCEFRSQRFIYLLVELPYYSIGYLTSAIFFFKFSLLLGCEAEYIVRQCEAMSLFYALL